MSMHALEMALAALDRAGEVARAKGRAIGAPGDYGYSTLVGQALYELAVLAASIPDQTGRARTALHNLMAADAWIELASLGEPKPDAWPWDGDPVLVHCRSLIPNEPGATGQARYWDLKRSAGLKWQRDWWWAGADPYRTGPICQTHDPVTHVRRIVPPVEG